MIHVPFGRKLVNVFADGNTNFDLFIQEHKCNHFCTFYGLSPPLYHGLDQSQCRSFPASCVEIEDPIPLSLTDSEEFLNSVLDGTDIIKLHISQCTAFTVRDKTFQMIFEVELFFE